MWFFIAVIAYVFLAVVLILDKKILTNERTTPAVFAFYSSIFLLLVGLAWFFGVSPLYGWYDWLIATISGCAFGLGLLGMYKAVEQGEASHLNPFIGGVITIATFFIAFWWLREGLSERQMIGIAILALASLLLSLKKKSVGFGLESGLWWAVVAGVAFAVSNVTVKYLYTLYPFWSAFVATRFANGIFGIFLVFAPSVMQSLWRRKSSGQKNQRPAIGLVAFDKVLAMVGALLLQVAIAGGSVTVVNALSGLQYGFMFVLIVMLTKFWPRVFNEYFSRGEMVLQTIAIILIVIGLAFVV